MTTIYDISLTALDGSTQTLEPFRGKVLLIVNVASRCGFTKQYAGLEALYRRHADRGLVILGFPCNQFGSQEPGNSDDIKQFCSLNYGVTFPVFAKIDVNGPGTHPLYGLLKSAARGTFWSKGVKWNFTKFLVDRTGKVVKRYGSMIAPASLEPDIEKLLQTQS